MIQLHNQEVWNPRHRRAAKSSLIATVIACLSTMITMFWVIYPPAEHNRLVALVPWACFLSSIIISLIALFSLISTLTDGRIHGSVPVITRAYLTRKDMVGFLADEYMSALSDEERHHIINEMRQWIAQAPTDPEADAAWTKEVLTTIAKYDDLSDKHNIIWCLQKARELNCLPAVAQTLSMNDSADDTVVTSALVAFH